MRHPFSSFLCLCVIALTSFLSACAPSRPPVPPGEIPLQTSVSTEDEQYGHEVLNELTGRYKLDRDDNRINRARDTVDKITEAAKANGNPWHVHVLADDSVVNAAATRGNYVFVWSGLFKVIQNDGELATVLSHEIGHVLAGHTAEDPSEEVNRILAGVLGVAAGQAVAHIGGGGVYVADLAESVVKATIEALIVNPNTQTMELEADQVGLFLMADAGYNPEEAVRFWERVRHLPEFSNAALEMFSTHPSTEARLQYLQELLPQAMDRYLNRNGAKPKNQKQPAKPSSKQPVKPYANPVAKDSKDETDSFAINRTTARRDFRTSPTKEIWTVEETSASVLDAPHDGGKPLTSLTKGTEVEVLRLQGRWLHISKPVSGFLRSRELAPKS